jgi:hypothetical protein
MKPTAAAISAQGLTPGLWLLPFGGNYKDPFFAPHPEWFVRRLDGTPFDNRWGGTCLDMSHPGARDLVRREMEQASQDWGYSYFKLDGLYGGIGVRPEYVNSGWKEDNLRDGVFHDPNKTPIEVYRGGLRLVRDAIGPHSFILGCCAAQNMRSYAGSFGLVEAMRVGPDVGGTWASWSKKAPTYGARHYHLNGRIWWCDPDPFYVRDSLPLEQARCTASWAALSGLMISMSDWLPTLSPDRLDIIRRCIPSHGVESRPVDLFDNAVPAVWLASDTRPNRLRRDVVGLFNWGSEAMTMTVTVASLGLPKATSFIAYDFWAGAVLKPFKDAISLSVPATDCRILAIRPHLDRPFLLSTSRHVTQGILEVKEESWEETKRTLAGTSAVVARDKYEMRVVVQSPAASWRIADVAVSTEDQRAGVKIALAGITDGVARISVTSPASRDVRWSIRCER